MLELNIPRHLDIFADHDELCVLMNQLTQHVVRGGGKVLLKFHLLETVKSSALLCLAACIQAARRFGGENCVNGTFPARPKVEAALDSAGFYKLIKVDRHGRARRAMRREWIEQLTDTKSDGERVEELRNKLFGINQDLKESALGQIYVGLTEAMNNVVQHAYGLSGGSALPFVKNRWWLTGQINPSRRTFAFSICDLGVGIPQSLSTRLYDDALLDKVKYETFKSKTDPELLQLALLIGETSTDLPWRGKGLRQMRGVVDAIGGRLAIASGFGSCVYEAGNSQPTLHVHPLVGTLIEWTVPLERVLA